MFSIRKVRIEREDGKRFEWEVQSLYWNHGGWHSELLASFVSIRSAMELVHVLNGGTHGSIGAAMAEAENDGQDN